MSLKSLFSTWYQQELAIEGKVYTPQTRRIDYISAVLRYFIFEVGFLTKYKLIRPWSIIAVTMYVGITYLLLNPLFSLTFIDCGILAIYFFYNAITTTYVFDGIYYTSLQDKNLVGITRVFVFLCGPLLVGLLYHSWKILTQPIQAGSRQ